MRQITLLLWSLPLLAALAPTTSWADNTAVKRILVVHSQAPNHPWIAPLDTALKQALINAPIQNELYTEYLDVARFPSQASADSFMRHLLQKYSQTPPDFVVTIGLPATHAFMSVRPRIAPDKPLIAMGVKEFMPPELAHNSQITIADNSLDVTSNFRLIRELLPEAQRLIVYGYLQTPNADKLLKEALGSTEARGFAEIRVDPERKLDAILPKLAALPKDSAVLIFGFLDDASGATLSPASIGRRISDVTPVPAFSLYDSILGSGIVGGRMLSGASQGEVAAGLIGRLLNGEPMSSLPRDLIVPTPYMFDARALRRFGLDDRTLPADSKIINRQPSLYETNPAVVISGIAAIVLLIMGLGTLLVVLRIREKARHALAIANDELETRVAERGAELAQAMEQLLHSEKLASLGSLVAGIAHEMNTPIGNAYTVATTLRAHSDDFAATVTGNNLTRSYLTQFAEEVAKACGLIERNVQRATDLISSFKQTAVDQTSERRRKFGLAALVKETLHTLSPGLKHEPVSIVTDIAEDITLDSQPGALAQVITNLVNNAVIHARGDHPKLQINLRAERTEHGDRVRLSLADDGIGMAAEVRKRIFDPFFTTRLGQGGSGLGLYLVHNLVTAALGGTLQVQSAPGEGSRFDIELPLIGPEMGPEMGPEAAQG